VGRPDDGVAYSQAALRLEAAADYDPFEPGWSSFFEALGETTRGNFEMAIDLFVELSGRDVRARIAALGFVVYLLPLVHRTDEALDMADEAVEAARSRGNPALIAAALLAHGRALRPTDPHRALNLMREAHELSRAHRILDVELVVARDVASLEGIYGDIDRA